MTFRVHAFIMWALLTNPAFPIPTKDASFHIDLSNAGRSLVDDQGFIIPQRLHAHYHHVLRKHKRAKSVNGSHPVKRSIVDMPLDYEPTPDPGGDLWGDITVGTDDIPIYAEFSTGAAETFVPGIHCDDKRCRCLSSGKYKETGELLSNEDAQISVLGRESAVGRWYGDWIKVNTMKVKTAFMSVHRFSYDDDDDAISAIDYDSPSSDDEGTDRFADFELPKTDVDDDTDSSVEFGTLPYDDNDGDDDSEVTMVAATCKGFVGLGFKDGSTPHDTVMDSLYSSGELYQKLACFSLLRSSDGTSAQSKLSFGGHDTNRYSGDFNELPILPDDRLVQMDGVKLNSNTFIQRIPALFDPALNGIFLQRNLADVIGSVLDGVEVNSAIFHLWAIPCKQTASVSLIFGSKHFELDAKDLIIGKIDREYAYEVGIDRMKELAEDKTQDWCLSAFVGLPELPEDEEPYPNLIGSPFMKSWYTCFDWGMKQGHPDREPTIQLAKSKIP